MTKRRVWTRDGKSELQPIRIRGRRREDIITDYAQQKPVDLRQPTDDIYRRAYMRAGLMPGDPDSIDTRLPVERGATALDPPAGTTAATTTGKPPHAPLGTQETLSGASATPEEPT